MRGYSLIGIGILLMMMSLGCEVQERKGCGSAMKTFPLKKSYQKAPDFTLPTLENSAQSLSLSQFTQDNAVLLVFWATWCPSCITEIPILNEWHQKFGEQGLKILAVNVKENQQTVLDFKQKHLFEYPVVMDGDGKVADTYGLAGLPVALFLAKGGEILYYGFGLPANLDHLLAQGLI